MDSKIAHENKRRGNRTDKDEKRPGNAPGLRAKTTERIAKWNICGITNKEAGIVELMENHQIRIMGVADCRLKNRRNGNNIKIIHNSYTLIWSGVALQERAKHGVGLIFHPDTAKNIVEFKSISERIMSVRLIDKHKATTIIQTYAPCNDSYREQERQDFYDQLSEIINEVKDTDELFVMGDLNGRVGGRTALWEQYLGPFSDDTRECNSNRKVILE